MKKIVVWISFFWFFGRIAQVPLGPCNRQGCRIRSVIFDMHIYRVTGRPGDQCDHGAQYGIQCTIAQRTPVKKRNQWKQKKMEHIIENVSIHDHEIRFCARYIRQRNETEALRALHQLLLIENRRASVNAIYRVALFVRNALAEQLASERCTTESACAFVSFLLQEASGENFDSFDSNELEDLGIAFDVQE